MPSMRAFVGVTDWDWYQLLASRGLTEANFWQPSGGQRFSAIPSGAPFFFKTHYSHRNRIVGGGFLSGGPPCRCRVPGNSSATTTGAHPSLKCALGSVITGVNAMTGSPTQRLAASCSATSASSTPHERGSTAEVFACG